MKKLTVLLIFCMIWMVGVSQSFVTERLDPGSFSLRNAVIFTSADDDALIQTAASCLQNDMEMVTGSKPDIVHVTPGAQTPCIYITTLERSVAIRKVQPGVAAALDSLKGKWETYFMKTGHNSFVIAGSDRRGTAYGVFELSRQMGVSPWYWWADVPVEKKRDVFISKHQYAGDGPKVKYRGIFINDEAPALSGWAREKFGGFNHKFYEKVFELILRLKGNYLWPAMWGSAFYADDPENIKMSEKYGIVVGTSHHEPLMRAHAEWKKYGGGEWNYETNEKQLKEFWKAGMKRAANEKIVTIGMRGDGDEPMSRETATALLERIVRDQREIIAEVTGEAAENTPQLWALYKEVQDYYEKGMRVPGDVTLLLCDDNWGNIRKLPKLDETPREGGYGIYYHFDYVGGPRNYKWLNTSPLPRIWEQMHLAWEYNARKIRIVNVGDIKPMELPVSFFLDYAWNPESIGPEDLQAYTEAWAARQFNGRYTVEIAGILAGYAKLNARRKPELLDENTYSFNYGEWPRVVEEYNELLAKAEQINNRLPAHYRDAFFQLVLHPVKACANLNEMYYNVAMNQRAYRNRLVETNSYAERSKRLYEKDSLITLEYHRLNKGKWNHLMSQVHIGYTGWQQPGCQEMPEVKYLPADSVLGRYPDMAEAGRKSEASPEAKGDIFFGDEEKGISIAADHYTRAVNTAGVRWQILPDHGRTGSAVTPFPVTAKAQQPGTGQSPYLEYEFRTFGAGEFTVDAYFSPTLNFHNTEDGLQYGISIDNEASQIISLNKEDKTSDKGIWNKWVAENINIRQTKHQVPAPGKHTLKFWMVSPGVVLQKLVLGSGNVEKTYLGPPEALPNAERKLQEKQD